MFPAGGPGIALLVLRVCTAALLLISTLPGGWELGGFLLLLSLLCLGLFTPAVCLIATIVVGLHLPHVADLHTLKSALIMPITLAVAVLGPGAFSIDAKLFGRRLLSPPPDVSESENS
jgi:hypothetical protein